MAGRASVVARVDAVMRARVMAKTIRRGRVAPVRFAAGAVLAGALLTALTPAHAQTTAIGRASCRERVSKQV